MAHEAKPIQSLTFDTAVYGPGDAGYRLCAERHDGTFATPASVDGTARDDVMNVGYTGAHGDEIDGGAGDDEILGDLVTTLDGGAQPVVWTARHRRDATALAAHPGLCPVRIRAARWAIGATFRFRRRTVSRSVRWAPPPVSPRQTGLRATATGASASLAAAGR